MSAWDLSSPSLLSTVDLSAQDIYLGGITFSPDGLEMFAVGSAGDVLLRYTLSSAWDPTSATFVSSFDPATQFPGNDLWTSAFSPDGTTMLLGGWDTAAVFGYTLSTPWDPTSATFTASLDTSLQMSDSESVSVSADGTKVFAMSYGTQVLSRYNLSTPWDLTSASHVSDLDLSSGRWDVDSQVFSPDGTKLFLSWKSQYNSSSGLGRNRLERFDLSTAWDITTAVSVQSTRLLNFITASLSADGTRVFGGRDKYGEKATLATYSLIGEGPCAWQLPKAEYVGKQAFTDLPGHMDEMAFSADGRYMVLAGTERDVYNFDYATYWDSNVATYVLSTPWDPRTATLISTAYLTAGPPLAETWDSAFYGVNISPDGTKLYSVGYHHVPSLSWPYSYPAYFHQWSLPTPFDLTGATFDGSVAVMHHPDFGDDELVITDLQFTPDGTSVWLTGWAYAEYYRWDLSTAWDLTTASYAAIGEYTPHFNFPPRVSSTNFSPDGLQMFTFSYTWDFVTSYVLGSPFDVEDYSERDTHPLAEASDPMCLALSDDGAVMLVLDRNWDDDGTDITEVHIYRMCPEVGGILALRRVQRDDNVRHPGVNGPSSRARSIRRPSGGYV